MFRVFERGVFVSFEELDSKVSGLSYSRGSGLS